MVVDAFVGHAGLERDPRVDLRRSRCSFRQNVGLRRRSQIGQSQGTAARTPQMPSRQSRQSDETMLFSIIRRCMPIVFQNADFTPHAAPDRNRSPLRTFLYVLSTNCRIPNHETALRGVYICTRSTPAQNRKQAVAVRLRRTPLGYPPRNKMNMLPRHPFYRIKMESDLPQKLLDLLVWSSPIAISSRLPIRSHNISSADS